MKYILLFILFSVVLGSCNDDRATKAAKENSTSSELTLEKVDGCEYVFYNPSMNSGGAAIVHHGNCHNPIHKQ